MERILKDKIDSGLLTAYIVFYCIYCIGFTCCCCCVGKADGTVIDDAAYQWDGQDKRFGLGDYRIPKVMLTYPNSSRRDPPTNKGEY